MEEWQKVDGTCQQSVVGFGTGSVDPLGSSISYSKTAIKFTSLVQFICYTPTQLLSERYN